jgi:hypothetical protein
MIKEIDNKELTFEQLEKSPIKGIELDHNTEEKFKKCLNENKETLIYIEDIDVFTYENLPIIARYLLDTYDYCTKLKEKNNVEYKDWKTARLHMESGNKAKFQEVEYFIKDGDLYWEFKSKP